MVANSSAEDFSTAGSSIPSGRSRRATETRSRTSAAAASRSVPARSSTWMKELSSRLMERIRRMPSTPESWSSMARVTSRSTTSAAAPV
jgi:hypothetical protein